MATSLWNSVITVDTPGVIYATEVTPRIWYTAPPNGSTLIDDGLNRDDTQIDSDYIVGGGAAYVTIFRISNYFLISLSTDPMASDSDASSAGPEFTDSAETNMGVAVRLTFQDGTTQVYKWTFGFMFGTDRTEPYRTPTTLSYPTSDFPTPTHYTTAQTAQIIFVDRSHSNIDWDNLEFTNTIDVDINDLTETLYDGAADVGLSGTFDQDNNDSVMLAVDASEGTLGSLNQDDTNETWSVTLSLPAAMSDLQTVRFWITATNSGSGYGIAVLDLFVRGLTFNPVHHPDRDFNIENEIRRSNSLWGIWADPDDDLLFVVDSAGEGASTNGKAKAFVFSARTRIESADLEFSPVPLDTYRTSQPRGLHGDVDSYIVGDASRAGAIFFDRSDNSWETATTLQATTESGQGLTGNSDNLFQVVTTVSTGDQEIVAWDLVNNQRDTSASFAASVFEDEGIGEMAGIYTDGDTLWIVDTDAVSVVAFDLDAKTRKAERDFSLIQANGDPWGIWADDTHFYITDTAAQKVFAYAYNLQRINLPEINDFHVETGQDISIGLPVAEVIGPENSVASYELSNLPSGLTFNADQRTFSGTIGSTAEVRTLTYTATDVAGNSAESEFRLITWKARPTLYPWEFQQIPTAPQFNDHISDFIDYYAGRDGEFRPLDSYQLPNATPFAVLYLDSDGNVVQLAPGEFGQILYGQGTGSPPSWGDYTGDDFEVEDWLISRFDDGDSDWMGDDNATRKFVRDHSLGRIPRLFSWCFEYVGTSLDADTGYSQNERVFMPLGVLSSGQEDWAFEPRLLWASSTQAGYEVARWPEQTVATARFAGFLIRHRASGAKVLARNIQVWGLRLFLWG